MPQSPGRVARARLRLAEHHERDAGVVQQLGHGAGGTLCLVVERAGAADPEEVFDVVGDVLGPKVEYRDTLARWEPMGTGALGEATRYWTQSELNSRLIELNGALLFNRIFAILLGLAFLGLTLWRFTMTERAPSRWKLRRLARRKSR